MKTSKIIVVLVLVSAAIYFIPRMGKSTDIEQKGKELSITVGKHHMTASIIGPEISDSFLVICGSCKGDLYFTSLFSVIPLDTAERLAQRYGNFFRCNSPGASEGKNSVKSMILYAASRDVERRLKKIEKLTIDSKKPVIKMTYVELKITNHTIKGRGENIKVVSRGNFSYFLVKDVQLIEEDRIFE